MIVTKDKVVSLTYELRIDDPSGEIVEALSEESPLVFLYGSGNLLPKFEENIDGLGVGEQFDFDLEAMDAYGEMNQDAIVNVPVQAFEIDGKIDENMLKLGNKIPMQDSQGNRLTGTVKEITADAVVMDFNHPLAGNRLFFKGAITDIREATEDELSHGHVHPEGSSGDGCSSCGCGGHGHDGGCDC